MSPTANMLVMLKNAQMARHESVMVPFSKLKESIANVLKKSGFLHSVENKKKKIKNSEQSFLLIKLKYAGDQGVINGINLISKPSRRMYVKKSELHLVRHGYGLSVVSTPKGIMSGIEARKAGVGGEIIFEIW